MDERALDLIYAAAVDETALYELLAWLARTTGSRGAGVYRISGGGMDWERSVGMPEAFMAKFARDYAPHDPRIEYLTRFPVCSVHSDAEPEIRRTMRAGPVADFVESNDLHYTAGALLSFNEHELSSLYISRSSDQGAPGEDVLTALGGIMPHFARSMRIRQWNHSIGNTAAGVSDSSAPGRMLLDLNSRVRWLEARAERILECSGAGRLWLGRIVWNNERARRWMDRMLRLAAGRRRPDWLDRHLHCETPGGMLHVTIAPATPPGDLPAPLLDPARNWLMLVLRWRAKGEAPFVRLTPRQREVLDAVSRGLSSGVIAQELGCTKNTVRNHVQALLEKLEVSNRIELVNRARGLGLIGR